MGSAPLFFLPEGGVGNSDLTERPFSSPFGDATHIAFMMASPPKWFRISGRF